MKNLKRISYIMISLILFQSFSAVANSLDFHAIDTQHLQHEHKHSEHEQVQSDLSAKATSDKVSTEHHNPADCHHCGHCHGTHAQWVSQNHINILKTVVSIHNFNYLDAVIDAPINRLLRPPKITS
ncbi:hypothetical protein ACI7YQ_11250 [Alteromonas marina]|nr:hypothetical protein BM527_11070 [Alteromonas sp. Mex14]